MLRDLPGSMIPIGPVWSITQDAAPGLTSAIIDDVGEAHVCVGNIVTSDGASHTIDTTGSSAIIWRTGTTSYGTAGSVFKVGIAAVDTSAGPPVRAVNVADIITFDVSKTCSGAGSIPSISTQVSVPDAGSKTIANGDLVAVCFQLVTKGGSDIIRVVTNTFVIMHRPTLTTLPGGVGGVYTNSVAGPNFMITFSDGATGYMYGTDFNLVTTTRTFNSGSAQAEYGQLFQMPFGMKISGLYGWADPDADFDMVLYSDPLGTPVAERTVSIDANTCVSATGRRITAPFPTPYIVKPSQPIVAAFKPGGSNISAYGKVFNDAAHRVSDAYGTLGYGVQRTTGAFSNENSGLTNYYIGLMASGFEELPVQPIYALGI